MMILLALAVAAAPLQANPGLRARNGLLLTGCPPVLAKSQSQRAELHKLTDLPPADTYAAMLRVGGNCPALPLLRSRFGGGRR
ncbi:hypothetical protein OMW55_08670 [Sphingomonas sp. BN140010]|uniref:Uncharacterized protein n=1 Tax=Sphingomonas arvum TaxID=2992113 RepID=A0ABT3JGK8_9SPHN|nr:hypothetical protein [Sphingomonas sp. BN140010]MCW3797875.1 hypothetical protein [Sphingomonas sp. BN140010]